jgi:hypothetical protein
MTALTTYPSYRVSTGSRPASMASNMSVNIST